MTEGWQKGERGAPGDCEEGSAGQVERSEIGPLRPKRVTQCWPVKLGYKIVQNVSAD